MKKREMNLDLLYVYALKILACSYQWEMMYIRIFFSDIDVHNLIAEFIVSNLFIDLFLFYHIIKSYYNISYNIISYHISYIISYHIHIISYNIISFHFISYHNIHYLYAYLFIYYHIISYHIILYHIT